MIVMNDTKALMRFGFDIVERAIWWWADVPRADRLLAIYFSLYALDEITWDSSIRDAKAKSTFHFFGIQFWEMPVWWLYRHWDYHASAEAITWRDY